MKKLLKKYGHIWVCGYILLYLPYFFWLESVITDNYKIMHVALDDVIPFSEYFIVPYMIWFFYVSGAVLYFFFTDKQDYFRLCTFLFIGMTISMMICTFYPNGTDLRVEVDPNKNVFCYLVQMIHNSDTPANVFPSIHVYNSVAAFSAIHTCKNLQKHKGIRTGSFILTTLIVLSTMFLKQHSIADVATGITCAVATYVLFYSRAAEKQGAKSKQRSPLHQHDTHM